MTRFDYVLETGAWIGKLPYTLLDIPRGNETFGTLRDWFVMKN